jgi:septum formation protein
MSEKTRDNATRSLVLASTSRYRKALLERLGLPFEIIAPAIDESPSAGEAPAATALRLAQAKARAVATRLSHALVIGSDQVADLDGTHVGKPGNAASAMAQLRALSGRTVVFHTGVALCDAGSGRCRSALVDVASTFRVLSDAEIADYLRREQPFDCAGGVKSEGLGIALFERIESGDPTALIGLPLIALLDLLRAEGVHVLAGASGERA